MASSNLLSFWFKIRNNFLFWKLNPWNFLNVTRITRFHLYLNGITWLYFNSWHDVWLDIVNSLSKWIGFILIHFWFFILNNRWKLWLTDRCWIFPSWNHWGLLLLFWWLIIILTNNACFIFIRIIIFSIILFRLIFFLFLFILTIVLLINLLIELFLFLIFLFQILLFSSHILLICHIILSFFSLIFVCIWVIVRRRSWTILRGWATMGCYTGIWLRAGVTWSCIVISLHSWIWSFLAILLCLLCYWEILHLLVIECIVLPLFFHPSKHNVNKFPICFPIIFCRLTKIRFSIGLFINDAFKIGVLRNACEFQTNFWPIARAIWSSHQLLNKLDELLKVIGTLFFIGDGYINSFFELSLKIIFWKWCHYSEITAIFLFKECVIYVLAD